MTSRGVETAGEPKLPIIRSKGSGRVFVRGKVWYYRFRANGIETTKSTGIFADGTSEESFEQSKNAAIKILDKETEILRLKEKESRLKIVKMMLEDTHEQIRDRISSIQRDAPLSRLEALFRDSSRRSSCSQEQFATYIRYISVLIEGLGDGIRISDIDDGIADTFASWLYKRPLSEKSPFTMSPNTYNKHLNGYTFIWNAVSGRIGLTANPWEKIPRKKLDTSVRQVLTEQESDSILAYAKGEYRTLIAIGLYTGLRLGDCVHLRWRDIHDGAVFVEHTRKTGAPVAIPLHAKLKAILDEVKEREDEVVPDVCRLYDTQGSSPIVRTVKRIFTRCGVETSKTENGGRARPVRGFHSLRSTFVTRCIAAGIPQAVVQALVGHASSKMTQHYTHLDNKDIIDAFSRT